MKNIVYRELEGNSPGFFTILAALAAMIAAGLAAVLYMEHEGHYVTGMTNQIVWGMPHIFAIFLILAASGALNVASIASVFGKTLYKPLSRLSSLLAITLLTGGLVILVLDLGHPDRLIVAMTTYNVSSIFSWNILLYNGLVVIVGIYLWLMMERRMNAYYPYAGFAAFLWRLILTTGTGSIFGFLIARTAYGNALLAPMFVAMSLAFGLAVFILMLLGFYRGTRWALGDVILQRLNKLLGIFVAAVLYFVLVYHLTNLYLAKQIAFESFMLLNGGIYTFLFWVGYLLIGTVAPLFLIYWPKFAADRNIMLLTSALVTVGAFSLLYVIIIGGQAFPLDIFPGKEVLSSSFGDANPVHPYTPSIWEYLLGLTGVAISLIATVLAARILPFLPLSLADADIDPHHVK